MYVANMKIHPEPSPIKGRSFQVRFVSIVNPGRSFCFPCDAQGQVDTTGMRLLVKNAYKCAVNGVGKTFLYPVVEEIYKK
jgi:hypothetical protein